MGRIQADAILKLQEDILREVENKLSGLEKVTGNGSANDGESRQERESEWVRRARSEPQNNKMRERTEPIPTSYIEIARKEEHVRTQTTNTNGVLTLLYVCDWRDESIGVIKKALRTEIGKQEGSPASNNGQHQRT